MKYKVNKGFIIQKLDKDLVIFDADESVLYTLNETATFVFQKLKRGLSQEEIIKAMVKRYDVEKERVKKDLNQIIKKLEKGKIIKKAK